MQLRHATRVVRINAMVRWNRLVLVVACGALGWMGSMAPLSAATVTGVAFGRDTPPGYDDPWIEVAVQLEADNAFAEAAAAQGATTLTIDFGAAWEVGRGRDRRYTFYQTQATLATLPVENAAVVFFYLPPEIVERDDLRPEPFAWRISLNVGERALPTQPTWISDGLRDPAVARSFAARLAENAPANAGLLQPIYLTPFWDRDAGKTRDLPTFIRREPRATGGQP